MLTHIFAMHFMQHTQLRTSYRRMMARHLVDYPGTYLKSGQST